jgi:hypothetical protein
MNRYIKYIGIIIIVLMVFALPYEIDEKPQKYVLKGSNETWNVSTQGVIKRITAEQDGAPSTYLDESGITNRRISAKYIIHYQTGEHECLYDVFSVASNGDDVNMMEAIRQHAIDKWGFDIQAKPYSYRNITSANQ